MEYWIIYLQKRREKNLIYSQDVHKLDDKKSKVAISISLFFFFSLTSKIRWMRQLYQIVNKYESKICVGQILCNESNENTECNCYLLCTVFIQIMYYVM